MIQLNNSNITLTSDHRYFDKEGKQYKGITKLIAKHITGANFDNVDPLVLKIATDYGNGVHEAIDKYIKSQTVSANLEELDRYADEVVAVRMIEMWDNRFDDFIASEYIVSDNKNYASPIDIVASKDDGVYLIDIKTTSQLHKKAVAWQLSIYKYFFEICNPDIKVLGIGAIHIQNKEATLHDLTSDIIPETEVKRLFEAEEKGVLYGDLISTDLQLDEDKAMMLILEMEQHLSKIDEYKKEVDRLKSKLEDMTAEFPPFSLKNDLFYITKVAESTRVSVNSEKLQSNYPDIYNEVKQVSNVKSYVVFGLTKESKNKKLNK